MNTAGSKPFCRRDCLAVCLFLGGVALLGGYATICSGDTYGQVKPPAGTAAADEPYPLPPELVGVDLMKQTREEADAKSNGCVSCHQGVRDPHFKETVRLGCVDCHGGDARAVEKEKAH